MGRRTPASARSSRSCGTLSSSIARSSRVVGVDEHPLGIGQTLQSSFSAVSKRNFARKYALESSRRDLHNALLCTALQSHFMSNICQKFATNLQIRGPLHARRTTHTPDGAALGEGEGPGVQGAGLHRPGRRAHRVRPQSARPGELG